MYIIICVLTSRYYSKTAIPMPIKAHYAILWLVFTWYPYPWSPVEITPVLTTFCWYYPDVHYFYVPWLIMTSQWIMTLLGMPHCGTTNGIDVARDIHCDTTIITLLCVHNMTSQWIMTLLGTSFAMYYYAELW